MPALESDLRRQLENVVIEAREVAEAAARSKLTNLGVAAPEAFNARDRDLRNRLRARGRQVGDVRNADKTQPIDQLTQELAYEYWHRMLFARFLAENGLLIDPELEVGVNLEYCEEVAVSKGAANGFVLAARFASTMLPQIFRTDDVLLEIEFAPEQRLALEKLLASLPPQTFLADDSLGWAYQFWQTKRKKEVNDSGRPIDGRTLPAVTQLFTEHYMVQFLLHNTIGAWWCGRHGINGHLGGAGVPAGQSPVEMEYLRWAKDGTPAAGKFDGWPKTFSEFKMLDPCCGSGHFLVAAFNLLVPLRMQDEDLTAEKACESVLRDNLFGLELDPRCTQIAAFALALTAWKYPDAGGYRVLPPLNIACSGQGITGKKEEWLALANGNERLREGMQTLYDLFKDASVFGSLIDPQQQKSDLFVAEFSSLLPLLTKALESQIRAPDCDTAAIGVAARGIADATVYLTNQYSLVATNVPYLGRHKQGEQLIALSDDYFAIGKADIATAFLLRSLRLCRPHATVALVLPRTWLFAKAYRELRPWVLDNTSFDMIAPLGPGAFETISGVVVNPCLLIATNSRCKDTTSFAWADVSASPIASGKASALASLAIESLSQHAMKKNPDCIITNSVSSELPLFSDFAVSVSGLKTGDMDRFTRHFWEIATLGPNWDYLQRSDDSKGDFCGMTDVIYWQQARGELAQLAESLKHLNHVVQNWRRGQDAWGKRGVAMSTTGEITFSHYLGDKFDSSLTVLFPKQPSHLSAIVAFCASPEFSSAVRAIDSKLSVTTATLTKVSFDLDYWQSIASDKYGDGLPSPISYDPTQWIFDGDIAASTDPLQVAVARLLGYRWPEQQANESIDKLADSDGILCLPGVRGESAASERLLEVLRTAYGKAWSDSVLHKLLSEVGCKAGTTLEDWLRNQYFEQHCKRFQNRPFIWHIWDGRKDGFSALLNYHKLDHKTLENLTHSYLRDWIKEQTHDAKSGKPGADLRLAAAQSLQDNLKLILSGEPPYDIFVRWKPFHEQAIGWNPDLNDGVRQNIRPFIRSGVFKKEPKSILKDKDRGNEPRRDKDEFPWFWSGKEFVGERVNDVHLKNSDKQAARTRKEGAK